MVLEQIYGLFDPFTIWHIVILGAAGVGLIQLIIRLAYTRDPVPGRIGDYHMYMFHSIMPQKWKATLFRLDPTVTPALEKVFAAKGTSELAEMFAKNQGKLFFYLARHMPMPTGTLTSGYSIIATNADLDHSEYHKTWEDHWLSFRGYSSRVRDVAQSGPEGMIMPDRVFSPLVKKTVNLIYYDAKPMVKNPTVDPAKVEFLQVALESVTVISTWNKTAQITGEAQRHVEVLGQKLRESQRDTLAKSGEANFLGNALAKDLYDKTSTTQVIQSLNPFMAAAAMFFVMLAAFVFMPPKSGADMTQIFQPLLMGGMVAFAVIYLMSRLIKPQTQIAKAPVQGEDI